MAVDWADPCQRYKALNDAYFMLISGGKAATIEYTANGVARKVQFSFSNINALNMERLRSEDACLVANGKPPKNGRFAIQAGSRRRWNDDPFRVWGD